MTTDITNGFYAYDLEVTIDQQGAGRPILLLHGGGGPPSMGPLPSALSQDFEVITPVHPGFAGTPRPEWYTGIDDIALTYLQLLEQRDLRDVLVIGSSIGGWIASEMAVREHDRITGTVLLNAVGINVEGIELADFFSLTPQELIAHSFHDPAAAPDPAATTRARRNTSRDDLGRERPDRTRAYGRAYAASFPNGRFEPIPQAGHLPHLEQPQQVLSAIHRFAEETTRSATTQPGC